MPSRSWTSTPRSFCPTDPPEVTDVPDDFPRPAADDEGQHPPGEEELWNESWYFDAVAEAHDDQSGPLRGESGRPLPVGFDAVWETDGVPYAYRMTTRYEIPCQVAGT